MKKEEYLHELTTYFNDWNEVDQEDVIRYVSEYFDDADNEEQVLKELGTPQEFIREIRQDQINPKDSEQNEASLTTCKNYTIDRISIHVDLGDVLVERGTVLCFQAIGVPEKEYKTFTTGNTLYVESRYRFHFLMSIKTTRYLYRLTIPSDMQLQSIEIETKLGNVVLKEINSKELSIKEHLGDIRLTQVWSETMKLTQKMGEIDYVGSHPGTMELKNAMGSINIVIDDYASSFNYDLSTNMGTVKVNGDVSEGFHTALKRTNKDAEYQIIAQNRMGDIKLRFQK